MAGFGIKEQSQQQQQSSYSGLRGTPYSGGAAKSLYNSGRRLDTLGDRVFRNVTTAPEQYYEYGKQLMPGGRYGMGANVDAGVNEYGRDMFSQTSADMGGRGFVSPENQGGVIGSAIQRSLPQLIPQMMDFQRQQFMAPQDLLNAARTGADFWNQAMGTQQTGSGSGRGYGFDLNVAKFA